MQDICFKVRTDVEEVLLQETGVEATLQMQ